MHRVGERQRWAWLTLGLSAAVAACACGLGWLWVLLGGGTVSLYYIYIDRNLPAEGLAACLPGALSVVSFLWTVLAMAWAANLADSAFPMVDGFPVLGWTMLALAAWGVWKGAAACARCAGVLCLFLVALYGVVGGFALPDVELSNLRPAGNWVNAFWAAGLFLLPAGVWYVPCEKSSRRSAWPMGIFLTLAAALLAAVTDGVLSPLLAASTPVALYTLAQSVSLFGVVERIEPLLSAAMVMGVFGLLSSMACACGVLRRGKGTVACIAAALLMGPVGKVDLRWITAGAAIVWVLIPMAVLLRLKKLSKKAKKGVDKGGAG